MASPELFAPRDDADIARLIAQAPLAWVVSLGGGPPMATPLPLAVASGAQEAGLRLYGHFARNNPQVEHLRRDPSALLLFMGPHAYVSPSWMSDRTQAPTWNYACLQMQARIEFDDRPDAALEAVGRLSSLMEHERPNAWSPAEMGSRLERLARGVVAFHATITTCQAKFKMGQDERPDVFADILAGLARTGEGTVEAWMRRFAGESEQTLEV
jgi:transcriptional regulator